MPKTLADIRARVIPLLKRKDVTTSNLNEWIGDAVRRIQRTLHTPIDEATAVAVVTPDFSGKVNVPGNLLTLRSITVDGVELTMRPISEVNALLEAPAGQARVYTRIAGQYVIAPRPQAGTKIEIYYHADYENVTQDTDTLKLFDVADDLVMYGTLIRGADWSRDERNLALWNEMYNSLFVELQDLSDRDDLLNASIAPAYNSNGDWY